MISIINRLSEAFRNKGISFYFTCVIASSFSIIVARLCFINNDYLNLVSANFVDSGSILGSLLSMTSLTGFYNQNLMYHGFYGYPYNSLVFFIFLTLKIFGISPVAQFSTFATFARLTNLFISVLVIIQIYRISIVFLKRWYIRILFLIFAIIFPPFFLYSFQLKQDVFGLFFSLLCVYHLYEFVLLNKKETLWKCILFFSLATLNKQPFIFLIIPLGLTVSNAFLRGDKASLLKQSVKGILLSLIVSFLIHPYIFLDFGGFIAKQSMLFSGNIAQRIATTSQEWLYIIFRSKYLLLISFAPLFFLLCLGVVLLYRRSLSLRKEEFLTASIAVYVLVYVIWLIMKVGPLKSDAYFLPIYVYSLLLIAYIMDITIGKIVTLRQKTTYVAFLIFYCMLVGIISLPIIASTLQTLREIYISNYTFKTNPVVKFADEINKYRFRLPKRQINIVHTVSIPINARLFKSVKNTWQFGNISSIQNTICVTQKPDVVVIDKNYPYEMDMKLWSKTLNKCNMTNKYPDSSSFALFY